ncbi:hypothetical protein B0H14DRAFT_3480851 [Mycena olivaceomarginata]|nr:hypothetical protein B0H14DRAFT_3480851 [Mycena olivaceomarginata]
MDEFIDGAGGAPADLAATIVRHINHAVGDRHPPLAADQIFFLLAAANFLGDTTTPHAPNGPYEAALLAHGLVGALVKAICALNTMIPTQTIGPTLLNKLLSLLSQWCLSSPGYPWIAEALQAGLLRAIIPPCLVYRSVLEHMPMAMDDVRKLVNTQAFQNSRLCEPWQTFAQVVDNHLTFLSLFLSENYVVYRACDNLECSQIREKSKFSRCSACLEFYYCSRECQSIDWKAGHKQMCPTFRSFRLGEVLSCRDLSFLRELVHVDFLRNHSQILTQAVTWLASYSVIKVGPMDDGLYQDPRAEHLAARSAMSGGRMVLHRVVVREGAGMRIRMFRMRFRDRQMHEQLLTLAKSLPHQTDEREAVVAAACSSLPHIYPAQAWNRCGNFEAPFALPLDPKQAKLKGVPMSWATQAGSRNAGVLPALASYVATTATKPSIRIRCLAVALGNISVAPTQQNAIVLAGIVKKAAKARCDYLTHAASSNGMHGDATLDVMYLLTNEKSSWIDGLKEMLGKDGGRSRRLRTWCWDGTDGRIHGGGHGDRATCGSFRREWREFLSFILPPRISFPHFLT